MQLFLIRHGQSANNQLEAEAGHGRDRVPDPHLTELGRRQARRLADHVVIGALPRPDQLFTSLMHRAVETAAPLAEALDVPLWGHSLLHEVNGVYTGEYAGLSTRGTPDRGSPASVLGAISDRLRWPPDADAEGWYRRPFELPEEAWVRAQGVAAEFRERFGGTDAVVGLVTHAWFCQYLLRALADWPPAGDGDLPTWLELGNTGTVLVEVDAGPGRARVHWLNRLDHLSPDERSS